ncbi:hypothetical protein [Demequina aestuarii]|uniref:hypothetical protein n=1 Tax=Demequina aestuarii TaxID=327095 RepID=UPI0007844130|nr:hypothetical protein [Demequina aestuarii]
MNRAAERVVAVPVVLAALLGLAACSVSDDGPLVGPRVEPGEVRVCSQAGHEGLKYFSEPLVSTDDRSVQVTGVEGPVQGDAVISDYVAADVEDVGAVPASWWWPGEVGATETMAVMVSADDAEIPAGATALLVIEVDPGTVGAEAELDGTTVRYEVGGETYVEHVGVVYALVSGDAC